MRKSLLILTLALSFAAVAAPANAQQAQEAYCDPAVLQELVKTYQAHQKDLDESYGGLFQKTKEAVDDSISDLSTCIDTSFPTMSIQYPTMDMIIRGIAKQVVNKACSASREAMSKLRGDIYGSYYMNTRIPGVPSFGASVGTTSALQPYQSRPVMLPPQNKPNR